MRIPLIFLVVLAGCSNEANHLGNPFFLPISGLTTAASNAVYSERRGTVEVLVKSNHPALIDQINAGNGPILTQAMDAARIPQEDRETRIFQMQSDLGLYQANPGALVTALMVYGG
ncbi:MAG: hypothetical protein MUR46_12005 [Loktanella sp.]|jgi:hypothetical protein|nr:hypothetical protein [Loktanella sp.]MDO7608554.1 hypothetical protein [Loktanella sp.]MDO7623490.1 hypothetical protein [Loktanella sp.]MDO7627209.1 hypothetical protein [Loktanella sp.]MDO7664962.1 hypothetical protein [Loktanella sp.]